MINLSHLLKNTIQNRQRLNQMEAMVRHIRIQLSGEEPRTAGNETKDVAPGCLLEHFTKEIDVTGYNLDLIFEELNKINALLGTRYHPELDEDDCRDDEDTSDGNAKRR